jgi:hypothetical protein
MARQGIGGLRLLGEDWSGYGGLVGAALELEQLPRHRLEWLLFYAYARFYSRPRKWRGFQRSGRISAIPVVLAHIAASQVRKGYGRWRTPNGTAGSTGRDGRDVQQRVPETARPWLEGSPSA